MVKNIQRGLVFRYTLSAVVFRYMLSTVVFRYMLSAVVFTYTLCTVVFCGPGSSVGVATGYGLDGPGIESQWGKIFHTCPDQRWGPPSPLYNGYRVFPGGKERPGHDADPSPHSSAIGHERVELYLHSPYGPYSLYRASVPVQGCTLPFFTVVFRYATAVEEMP